MKLKASAQRADALKSLHKSNSFRGESMSMLPGGMALFVGL